MSDFATNVTALASLITAVAVLLSVFLNSRRIKTLDTKVEEVHTEVKTGNSQTLAQLADATESRRIVDIPKKERTDLEKAHVAQVPTLDA